MIPSKWLTKFKKNMILYIDEEISFSYYILCIGSSDGGAFRLAIQAAMRQYKTSRASSSLGTHEIQQITIGANAASEYQVVSCIW